MSFNRLGYDTDAYKQQLNESVGPMDYMLNVPTPCNTCYPENPAITLQKSGASTVGGSNFINVDVESELKGQTRNASNCPLEKFMPNCKQPNLVHYKDCLIPSEDTRTSNPPCNLRGTGWNRWEWLCINPQDKVAFDNTPNGRLPFDSDISTTTMIKDNHRPCLPVPLDQRLALPENGGNFVNEDPLSCDQVNCSVEKLWEVPTSAPVNYRDPNISVNYSTDMNPLNNNGNTVPVEPFSTQWRQNNLQSL